MAKVRMFNFSILEDAEPLDDLGFASPVNPEISFIFSDNISPNMVTKDRLDTVEGYSTYYYSTDDLLVRLEDNNPENLAQFDVNPDGTLSIVAYAYLKTKLNPEDANTEFTRIDFFNAEAAGRDLFEVVSINAERTEIQITFKDDKFFETYEVMRMRGLEIPEFGIISFRLPFVQSGRKFYQTFMIKYTDKPILTTPPRVETDVPEETSYTTPPQTFETMFIPTLSASFVYNFYESNEESLVSAARRNYYPSDFRQIAKYVKLTWNKAPILPASFYSSIERLERYFRDLRLFDLGEVLFPPPPPAPEEPTEGGSFRYAGLGSFVNGLYFGSPSSDEGVLSSIIQNSGRNVGLTTGLFDLGAGEDIREGTTESTFTADPILPGIADEEDIRNIENNSTRIPEGDLSSISPPQQDAINSAIETITAVSRYVGYVIVKELIDENGDVTPVDMIIVPDVNTTTYYDFKIAYGKTYRYKIRSMFRFVNRNPEITDIIQDTDATIRSSGSANFYFGNVASSISYYFDSEFSDPVDLDLLEFEKPHHPELFVHPNSRKKQIFLTWSQKDSSRDVMGFNVYRKTPKDVNYTKLNSEMISKRNNFYVDEDVEVDQEYIYTVESIDYHFNFSKLSNQIMAKIGYFDIQSQERCESATKVVHLAGLEFGEVPQNFDKFKFFKKKFKIIPNPVFANTRENVVYVLKIKSLDTGQEKEIKLNFKTTLINTEPARIRDDFDQILQTVTQQDRVRQTGDQIRSDLITDRLRGTDIRGRF